MCGIIVVILSNYVKNYLVEKDTSFPFSAYDMVAVGAKAGLAILLSPFTEASQ